MPVTGCADTGASGREQALTLTTIRIPDGEFHAELGGPVPRAVFLHGFGGDLHTWDLLWQQLGEDMPALRYDQRGYGETRAVTGPYDHSDDLCAVLDALDIVRCDLVGVSQGGGIALHFSLDHADRVRRLVLISPMLLGWDWSAEWRSRWQEIKELARAGRLDAARQSWWQHPLFDTTRDSAAAPALRASIQRYSGAQWLRDEHRPLPVPDIERLHELATPTLLLTGGRDQPDFRLIAELIAASAGRVQRIDRPALGHLLHLEDPVSTAQCIAEFLGADDT